MNKLLPSTASFLWYNEHYQTFKTASFVLAIKIYKIWEKDNAHNKGCCSGTGGIWASGIENLCLVYVLGLLKRQRCRHYNMEHGHLVLS